MYKELITAEFVDRIFFGRLRPEDIQYIFVSKDQIILAEAHCSYFSVDFRLICSYFVLETTVN